jgi:hypothetical protein
VAGSAAAGRGVGRGRRAGRASPGRGAGTTELAFPGAGRGVRRGRVPPSGARAIPAPERRRELSSEGRSRASEDMHLAFVGGQDTAVQGWTGGSRGRRARHTTGAAAGPM